jgi:hypothetical protein
VQLSWLCSSIGILLTNQTQTTGISSQYYTIPRRDAQHPPFLDAPRFILDICVHLIDFMGRFLDNIMYRAYIPLVYREPQNNRTR